MGPPHATGKLKLQAGLTAMRLAFDTHSHLRQDFGAATPSAASTAARRDQAPVLQRLQRLAADSGFPTGERSAYTRRSQCHTNPGGCLFGSNTPLSCNACNETICAVKRDHWTTWNTRPRR